MAKEEDSWKKSKETTLNFEEGKIFRDLSRVSRGKRCTRWIRVAKYRYHRANDNFSRIAALRVRELVRLYPLPHRDEIFILRAPPRRSSRRRRNETTTAPIDLAIYQLILSTWAAGVPITNSRFNHVQRAILS